MHYEKPDFVEIKMDAEIGSYQNEFDPDPRYAEPAGPPVHESRTSAAD